MKRVLTWLPRKLGALLIKMVGKRGLAKLLTTSSPALWVSIILIGLALFFAALWLGGSFSNPKFGEKEQIAFEEALIGRVPLPAMRIARDGVGAEFAIAVGKQIAEATDKVMQSEEAPDLGKSRPGEAAQAAWFDDQVCTTRGWSNQKEDYRLVMRVLVRNGFGDCGWIAQRATIAPVVQAGWGWWPVVTIWLLLLMLIVGAVTLYASRRAYSWLYGPDEFFAAA